MKRSEKAGTILHKQRYQYLEEVPTSQKLLALLTQADEKGVKVSLQNSRNNIPRPNSDERKPFSIPCCFPFLPVLDASHDVSPNLSFTNGS